jgi:hypothetical protein
MEALSVARHYIVCKLLQMKTRQLAPGGNVF